MKIRYLGTAAAEGWPALFCSCPICTKARAEGGRSAAQVAREAGRLLASLAEGEKLGGEPMVFLHYPPVYDSMECGGILDILEERRISHCYFGHIHGQYAARKALVGEYRGVRMHLISCDFVNFTPVLVAKG